MLSVPTMTTRPNSHTTEKHTHVNPALCASATTRLLWALAALTLLWLSIGWAMS